MTHPLSPAQLRKTYSVDDFERIAEELPRHRQALIGQDRAMKALRFGLGNRATGFNVYVSVPDGSSMFGVIRHFLEDLAARDPVPDDWCYVNNFDDAYCPNALRIPRGKARAFKDDIDRFIEEGKAALVKTFESEEYAENRNELKQELIRKQQEVFAEVNEMAQKEAFGIKHSPTDILVFPLRDGQPLTDEQFLALDEKKREEILEKRQQIQDGIRAAVRKSRELEKAAMRELQELDRRAALFALKELLEELSRKYEGIEEVPEYLQDLRQDILDNLPLFLQEEEARAPFQLSPQGRKGIEHRYEVNVLVDNRSLDRAPIVTELNPTYNNLFGKIERESVMGTLMTNFTLIRPGALHAANGGYLILPIEELLRSPFAWDTLKRALRNQRIEIEDPTEKLGFLSAKSLKPEPVPLRVQIILIGHYRYFRLLYAYDDDFKKLFKVKADFDPVMPATGANLKEISGYVNTLLASGNLLPLDRAAFAKLLEYGHRLVDHQEKITTQLEDLGDLLREADYYAREAAEERIGAAHIQRSVEEKKYRSDLLHQKIKELIAEGVIRIGLEGEVVGQINGLSVLDLGDLRFGRPSRITASVSLGDGGIMDIEREAETGGAIHTKGVLILSGFLYDHFGSDKSLPLAVRLVFEQNYGGVDGDSASCAELYAILSRLADTPLRQGIAVTGSIDQRGEVQAVGGINEKVEGFYEVCAQQGLTGEQGVIIPASNRVNLMLREAVVRAVEKGQFHIWAIDALGEGIEILSGLPAGKAIVDEQGRRTFEPGSFFHRVDQRLRGMAEQLRAEKRKEE